MVWVTIWAIFHTKHLVTLKTRSQMIIKKKEPTSPVVSTSWTLAEEEEED
jgi:hypothetical protein